MTFKTKKINEIDSAGTIQQNDELLGFRGGTTSTFTFSGGIPGGSDTQLQYNNDGSFGGISSLTYNGSNVTSTAGFTIDGTSDETQLIIQGHSTQTSAILDIQNSGGTSLANLDSSGVWTANKMIAGDPGLEDTGITINGTTYESVLKASDIGGTNAAQFIMHRHSTTLAPIIVGARTNSDTSAHAVVANGQPLLQLYATGHDGTDYVIGGNISFEVDGTPGSNDMPGRIVFNVTPDGSAAAAEAMRISQDKTVDFQAAIDLNSNLINNVTDPSSAQDAATKNYVDTNTISASSTDTLTNKTFDANGTGNSISNIDVADLADGTDGELITWGTSGAPTTVSVGTSGQILTSNGAGAAPTFQDAATAGVWNFLTSDTASDSSALTFTSNIDSTYDNYVIVLENLVMASDSVLYLRVSTDGGMSYISTGNVYEYAAIRTRGGSTQTDDTSAGAQQVNLTAALTAESDAGNAINGTIHMFSPSNTSLHTYFMFNTVFTSSVGGVAFVSGSGRYEATTAVNAIQISGAANISSGTIRLYGVSKS